MAKTIKAYKISEDNLKKNKMPSYNDLVDGVCQVSPVKMRKVGSYAFHVLEDVKGNIYLTENDNVVQNKLYERNLGITETKYMIDGVGLDQIKKYKESKSNDKEITNQEKIQGERNE